MNKIFNKYKKIIVYLFCGGISAVVEFLSFLVLGSYFNIYISSTVSFGLGLASSFILNKFVVFSKNNKDSNNNKEMAQFLLLGVINSQISSMLTIGLIVFIDKFIAKILIMIFVATWNYIIMNYVIFGKYDKIKNNEKFR